ncbi:Transporter [Aphis craccivora]|uniref:Transporter n=1 Tax=Aphis craccivora TaxID=307492 RepID=A0A6G0YEP2_APHCR|nr:Transporter [Aphis craccivora]
MHLESMHKTIKYHYLNGCKVGLLDKIQRNTKNTQQEYITYNLTINQDSANNWSVESEYTPCQIYKIKKIKNDYICCAMMCSNLL